MRFVMLGLICDLEFVILPNGLEPGLYELR